MLSLSDFQVFRWLDRPFRRYVYRCRYGRIEEQSTDLNASKEINDIAKEKVLRAHWHRAYGDLLEDLRFLEEALYVETRPLYPSLARQKVQEMIEKLKFKHETSVTVVDKGEWKRTP
jgi:hypothetical protein